MKSYLKTERVMIEALGEEIEIREISSRTQRILMEAHRDGRPLDSAAILCTQCVVGWEDETIESVESVLPPKALPEIARHIYRLSGAPMDADDDIPDAIDLLSDNAKNSEGVPSEGSSSDLPLKSASGM